MNKKFFYISIAGTTFFFIATIFLMFIYDGGTKFNSALTSYSFTHNFFSDLGRTVDFRETPQLLSHYLFKISIAFVGLSTILFSLAFQGMFENQKILKFLGIISGIIAGISYIGVGFTPWNLHLHSHVIFVKVAFSFFLILVFSFMILIFKEKKYPRFYFNVFLIFSLILIAYLILLFFGPSAKKPGGIVIQVVGQKIIAYSEITTMLIEAIGALKYLKQKDLK